VSSYNYQMASVSISETDKQKIIWNFMEELTENYQNAKENNLPTNFNFLNFFNFGILSDGFSEKDKIAVIKRYAKDTGYILIKGNKVTLTKKGLLEVDKPSHNWDTVIHN
jgi:hypothetical protein